jgi:endonuclease YncB( thermonuclease family)
MSVVAGMTNVNSFCRRSVRHRNSVLHRFALAVTLSLCAGTVTAQHTSPKGTLVGIPHIVDGDTLIINGIRIRLEGIDAPETDQVCLDAKAARWTCGIEARDRLKARVAGGELSCVDKGTDPYNRTLAICSLAGEDLNRWLVREGLALAYVQYSRLYVVSETEARHALRGLWSGAFIAPWDWRHRGKQTVILGALSVPVNAQSILLAPASAHGAPSADCTIKGNVNRKGERIYHMPGQRDYASINMTSDEKRWFCSPEEAEAAGWRPALR